MQARFKSQDKLGYSGSELLFYIFTFLLGIGLSLREILEW